MSPLGVHFISALLSTRSDAGVCLCVHVCPSQWFMLGQQSADNLFVLDVCRLPNQIIKGIIASCIWECFPLPLFFIMYALMLHSHTCCRHAKMTYMEQLIARGCQCREIKVMLWFHLDIKMCSCLVLSVPCFDRRASLKAKVLS